MKVLVTLLAMWAHAVNNRGQIVGRSATHFGDHHAFIWRGDMVGAAESGSGLHAVLWTRR